MCWPPRAQVVCFPLQSRLKPAFFDLYRATTIVYEAILITLLGGRRLGHLRGLQMG